MTNEKLKNIRVNSNIIRDKLVGVIILSLTKRPPSQSLIDEARITLRDSLFFRLNSVNYHLELLIDTHIKILKKIHQNMFNIDENLLGVGQNHMSYIFDDIVFNLCSILDYFGNLIGVIYIGDHKQGIKWTGCCKSARDVKNEFHNNGIAEVIDQEDRDWVDHLYKYRSRLIHNKKDNTSSSQQIQFGGDNITVTFKVDKPEMFTTIIKLYSKLEDIDNHSIVDLAVWLVDKCYDSIVNLINVIESDIQ